MSTGIYGQKILANVTASDLDILYAYNGADRTSIGNIQLSPLFNNITDSEIVKMIGGDGLYRLRLPASIFNSLGFYTILIKPKSYQTSIVDCSFIISSSDSEVQISKKGIVIPKLQFQSSGSLVGYMIQYVDGNGVLIKNFHRLITSSDLVSPAPNSNTSSSSSSQSYVLDSNGGMLFLTVSPDAGSIVSSLAVADLGHSGQNILVSNTFFDGVCLEIELTDTSLDTLAIGILGNSVRDNSTGVYSLFDKNNLLFKQYNLLTIKNLFSSGNVDVKQERTVINFNQNFLNLSQQTP